MSQLVTDATERNTVVSAAFNGPESLIGDVERYGFAVAVVEPWDTETDPDNGGVMRPGVYLVISSNDAVVESVRHYDDPFAAAAVIREYETRVDEIDSPTVV